MRMNYFAPQEYPAGAGMLVRSNLNIGYLPMLIGNKPLVNNLVTPAIGVSVFIVN